MAIRMRMAYLRKPSDRKRGDPTKQHLQPFKIQNKTMPYSPNLRSDFQVEDEASMKRHLKLLQMEFKKVVPNRQITKELMKRTYPKRKTGSFGWKCFNWKNPRNVPSTSTCR